jgi:Tfp pilus assembly protein PilF
VSHPIRVGWTPEQAFEAARIQLKRGALAEATTLIEQACAAAPAEPRYRALRAWLRVERGELEPGRVADEIVAILTSAVRHEPNNFEVRLYRALVLQRLCRNEEARRDFEAVASMDPGNRQAARALRRYRPITNELRPRRS